MSSYRKNLMLSLGPISTQVDLESVAPRIKSGLNRVCPTHMVKLSQLHECSGTKDAESHKVPTGEWEMGVEHDGTYKVVDKETRPKVEASGGLSLIPVPKKDLEAATFEGDAIYYAKPSTEHAVETWAIICKIVAGKTALIAKAALRAGMNTEKLWRVTTFNGYLVLREIRFPENVKATPDTPNTKVDKATYDLVMQFVEKLSTDWVDFDATDAGAQRLKDWLSDGTDVEAGTPVDSTAPTVDLKTMLEEALNE